MAEAREIALIWAAPGVRPTPATTEGRDHGHSSLKAAIDASKAQREDGKLAWLRAGTGFGSAVFDVQGIALLEAAYEEGMRK